MMKIAHEEADARHKVKLAKAVEDAVFGSLLCAMRDQEREQYWRSHADKLERKFTTEHGEHYSRVIEKSRSAQARMVSEAS